MIDWECPKDCKKMPNYGYECPDDLGVGEPCQLGIINENKNNGGIYTMNFKDMWNAAAKTEVKVFSNEDLPEGSYIAEVISCKLGPTKKGDKDMVSWDLKVIEGNQKNNHIFVNRSFSKTENTEENMKAINRALDDFKILGLPCEAEVLGSSMKNIVGKTIEISLKNGNSGQFKNFKRIVEKPVVITPEVINPDEVPFGLEEKPF